jgi:putative glutamine amidotransferase
MTAHSAQGRPVIGLTADVSAEKFLVGRSYVRAVTAAGGAPIVLPCNLERIDEFIRVCDGLVLTGGDDPITTRWGMPLHPKSNPVDPLRQEFELALLDASAADSRIPVLGICLGMQLMGLHAGATIDQHLADHLPTADQHWDRRAHEVSGELGRGVVHSHHRQALTDPGKLRVIATAPDGVIEAVRSDDRPFYVGVQWHPERTDDGALGLGVIAKVVSAAAARARVRR